MNRNLADKNPAGTNAAGRTAEQLHDAEQVAALVAAAAAGNELAWSGLVDHFAGLVWSVIRGYRMSSADAADVSQTTWLRLAEHIHKVREPERIGAWLATTAGRECLRLIRQNQRAVPGATTSTSARSRTATPPWPRKLGSSPWNATASCGRRSPSFRRRLRSCCACCSADPPPSYEEISAATGMPIGSIGPTWALPGATRDADGTADPPVGRRDRHTGVVDPYRQ